MSIKVVGDTSEASIGEDTPPGEDDTSSIAPSASQPPTETEPPQEAAEEKRKGSGRGWMILSAVLAILLLLGLGGNGYQLAQQAELHDQLAANSATWGQLKGRVGAVNEQVMVLQSTLADLQRLQEEVEQVAMELDLLGTELASFSDSASRAPAVAAGPLSRSSSQPGPADTMTKRFDQAVQWLREQSQRLSQRALEFRKSFE